MNKDELIAAMESACSLVGYHPSTNKELEEIVQLVKKSTLIRCAEAALTLMSREWVDVKERLPEDGQIIWAYDTEVHHCVYYDNLFYRHTIPASNERLVSYYWTEITHWMPLPTPPKDK